MAGRGLHPDTCTRVASRMSHRSCRGRGLWALGSEGRLGGAGQPLTALPHLEADSGLWSMGQGAEVGWWLPQETPTWLGRGRAGVEHSLEGASRDVLRWLRSQGNSHSHSVSPQLWISWHMGAAAGLRQPLPSRGSSWEQPRCGEVRYEVLRGRCAEEASWRWALKGGLVVTQQTGWWMALTTHSQHRPHRFKGSV